MPSSVGEDVDQEVRMDAIETAAPPIRRILQLAALALVCLTLTGTARADSDPGSGAADGSSVMCEPGTAEVPLRHDDPDAEACLAVMIGLWASPNPTHAGGAVSFAWSVSPETDCWDNLGNSAWGNYSFTRVVSEPFTWVVSCMGNGVESAALYIDVYGGSSPPPPPPPPPPVGGHDPKGWLDSVDANGVAYGWACDPDSYAAALEVRFYLDGAPGTGSFLGNPTASLTRESAVGDACGGSRNHGFAFTLPQSVHDGQAHQLYAYAVNIGDGNNAQLSDSPKSFTLGTTSPDADGDGIADDRDNCPNYYSTNNHCDSEPAAAVEDEGETSSRNLAGAKGCNNRWYARVERGLFGQLLWKYRLDIEWCWEKTRITTVSLVVTPQLAAVCCWYWRGTSVYDVADTVNDVTYFKNWGKSSFSVYTQGIFEWSFPVQGGFGGQYLPFIRFTAYSGGAYSRSGGGH
jgi:hypothetical protein